MDIDTERWTELQRDIITLRAQSAGLNAAMNEAENRPNQARIALANHEELLARTPIMRRESPHALVNDSERFRESQLNELRAVVAKIKKEFDALDAELSVVHRKSTNLQRIEQDCRKWCAERGVILPDEADQVHRPQVGRVQQGGARREFSAQAAIAALQSGHNTAF